MNPDLVKAKLESLSRCLGRIREKLPQDKQAFLTDWDAQDLVMKNVERAVQLCVDVANHLLADRSSAPPTSMALSFLELGRQGIIGAALADQLRRTVGLRNLAFHEYEALDYDRIYDVLAGGLGVFEQFAKEILGLLDRGPEGTPA